MINQDIIAQDLFYKIRSRFPKMEMGDETGQPTFEATKGRFFDFDAVFENINLGTVSISINEPGSLKLYFSRNILENVDDMTSRTWFKFLREMRKFAMKRLMSFDTRDITKTNLDKRDYTYLANKESVMNESSIRGTSRTSYMPLEGLERTRLIIRHKKKVDEAVPGARSRNIESLFIENASGERFKYPFQHLSGAKAMQRHVANGGVPHDPVGQEIIQISEQIAQLSSFKQYVYKEDLMNSETNHIVDRANVKLQNLKELMHKLQKQHHYESFKERISTDSSDDEPLIDEVTIKEYRDKFTVKNFKEDIASVFPLLYSIMQEDSIDLDEVSSENYIGDIEEDQNKTHITPEEMFENWADTLIETKLTPEQINSLKELVSEHFPLGNNGENTVGTLEDIGLQLPESFKNELATLAETDGPDTDSKDIVIEYLSQFEPEIYSALGMETAQVEELDTPPAKSKYDQFMDKRSADDRPGTKYYANGREVTGAEMDQIKQHELDNKSPTELELDDWAAKARQRAADRKAGKKTMENSNMMTDEERKAANSFIMSVAAKIKSGEVTPEEVESEFFNTLPFFGVDDEKAMAAWDRITKVAEPKEKKPAMSDADIDAELKGVNANDEDDDAAFLANLRNKAKSGGIKQDTSGFGTGLDEVNDEANPKSKNKEIAEFIMSFYNAEEGNFPLGEKAVALKVGKEFGDRYEKVAEMLCRSMNEQRMERDAFEELKVLSGMKKPAEGNKFTAGLANDDVKVGDKIPGTNAVKTKDIDEGQPDGPEYQAAWKRTQDERKAWEKSNPDKKYYDHGPADRHSMELSKARDADRAAKDEKRGPLGRVANTLSRGLFGQDIDEGHAHSENTIEFESIRRLAGLK